MRKNLLFFKILVLGNLVLLSACSVELQDKNQSANNVVPQKIDYNKEDLLISGVHTLPENFISYRKISFAKDAILLTEGKDLEILAETIDAAPGARILAHLAAAPTDQLGQAGGRLRLQAQSIQGELMVHLLGQEGGPGASGAQYTERAAKGFSPPVTSFLGIGNCDQTQPGGKGADGAPGRDGDQGKLGGDGGVVEIFIPSQFHSQVRVRVDAGPGGVGGRGGPGQLGGLGGDSQPGRVFKGTDPLGYDLYETCLPKPNLGEGLTGVSGRDGQKGLDGKAGTIFFQP